MEKRGNIMKKWLVVLIMFIWLGCAASNITRVEEKWGPPAKVEQKANFTIYYYYFQKGKSIGYYPGESGGITASTYTAGWLCVELTCDKDGNIIKKRKYWVQPRLQNK